MLGILLIYIIGRIFYDLADIFQKNKWFYTALGILSYYLGTIVVGLMMAIYFELYSDRSIDSVSDLTITFIAFPFGILTCYLFYSILKNIWTKEISDDKEDILDDDIRGII